MSPRACRSLRDLHEGTPKQRSAAGLRGRRKRCVWQAGDCRHSTPAQVAPVDAAHCATRAVSRLRKSKPYAQR
jgi:hypothetical protein